MKNIRQYVQKIGKISLLVLIFMGSLFTDSQAAKQIFRPAPTVYFQGKTLYVNGQPFALQGLTYAPLPVRTFLGGSNSTWSFANNICYINNPAAVCPNPSFQCTSSTCTCTNYTPFEFHTNVMNSYAYDADLPLIKLLGVNTLRLYSPPDHGLFQKAQQYGLRIFDTSFWIPDEDFTILQAQQRITSEFISYTNYLKQQPEFNDVMLMVAFGTENDLRFCTGNWRSGLPLCTQTEKDNQARAFYQMANSAIAQVKQKHPNFVPITIVNGNFTNSVPTYFTRQGFSDDSIMTALDAWS